MHLLYPCDPFDKKRVDDDYQEELTAAQSAGFACFLFSAEDFELGEFKPLPLDGFHGDILYRGWMLTPERYADLYRAIKAKGARMLVSPQAYRQCHYLPEWYDQCAEFTPKTMFLSKDDDFAARLMTTGWKAYFVKDFVKSLTTTRGSVARDAAEVREIVGLIERYRGQIEGGVCVREFEDLLPETGERYFVLKGQAAARDHVVPELVHSIANRITSPFFSVDIVLNSTGQPRLIELGDGQVSDKKKWSAPGFVEMFRRLRK